MCLKKSGLKAHGLRTMIIVLLFAALLMFAVGCSSSGTEAVDDNTEVSATPAADNILDGTGDAEDKSAPGYIPKLPTGVSEADIYVTKIDGISDDFIRGVDISSVLSQEESGVRYYDESGNEADLFKILADAGINYVRVRVWNDPYDSRGNGYGGGNCDTARAAIIGKRAADYGMKLEVDYHYSDFWADPSKQQAPKAWADMNIADKSAAVYEFTKNSLGEILEAGADVGIVQLGNETNKAMCGEKAWREISQLVAEGRRAVMELETQYGRTIQTALHFTNPEDTTNIDSVLLKLKKYNVEYDIFALSYYPFWHGTLDNLKSVMTKVATEYGKKVMIAETSYVYCLGDGDGTANSVDENDLNKNYAATVQSQANALRDVCEAVASVGEAGLGVFYWEPAWIPVGVYDYEAVAAAEVLTSNKQLWEKFGSGWASSYAGEYDPNDAGIYYGGSSWDNQALFDYTGHPLASLNTYKYLKYGAEAPLRVDYVNNIAVTINLGAELKLPGTVDVAYNNRALSGPVEVVWNEEQLSKIDTMVVGEYMVDGTFADGTTVYCSVKVELMNWLLNPGFEEEDTSMWNIIYKDTNPADYQKKETDAYSGEMSMHYWNTNEVQFSVEQTVTGLENGEYYFSLYAQGGDNGDSPDMYIYALSGGNEQKTSYMTDGWCEWKNPEIKSIMVEDGTLTVGVYIKAGKGAWGTLDDFYLCKLN